MGSKVLKIMFRFILTSIHQESEVFLSYSISHKLSSYSLHSELDQGDVLYSSARLLSRSSEYDLEEVKK